MVTPDNLAQVLMLLQSYGATRAKLGDFEVEFAPFAPEPEEVEDVPPLSVSPLAPPSHATTTAPVTTNGYASLFPTPPRFTPASE